MKKYVIISLLSCVIFATKVFAYNYHVTNENTENQLNCWVGWKKYHYGEVGVLAKKGDSFECPSSPQIINGVLYPGGTYTVTTNGYGYYSLEFNKHVLGLLSYMKTNASSLGNYKTDYVPLATTLVNFTPNEADGTVNLSDALSIAMNDMVSNWYSSSYENGEFVRFWDATFLPSHTEDLRKIQNRFYWKAYGESAYNKLTSMMGSYSLSSSQQKALKGVLFSIMEARYRNKNVQGKVNLQIKAAEGELWPFLVNLENLTHLSYDGNQNKYIDDRYNDTHYDFPDFDTLIEGAYQWMLYYDADTIRTTSHRTITKAISDISGEEQEEIEVEVDWESEFCDLTWEYLPALSGKELEDFYSKCQQVKSLFKKSSENTMGLFGAEELYDITSDINFSEAIRNMKTAMVEFCNGATMDSVWTGLTDYNIERTYIMAKNIVETNKVQDEFAYYDIGTNILTYTYGRHGKEYLLMDFQRVKLVEPLKDKYDNWTNIDTDGDGVLDRNELGDDSSDSNNENSLWTKVDITKFIKKSVEKELYGNDTISINSEEGKLMIDNAMAQVKYNIYKERQKFIEEHPDDNICDRKEDKENYLNIDAVTESRVSGKSDVEIREIMKGNNAKLQVRLWKYKSNPVLMDTDFDGIDDNEDRVPKDNHFTGRMHTTRLSGDNAIEVDMNMDYRYFFMSNKLYFDELSTMSLLYSNSIYRKGEGRLIHSGLQLRSANNFVNESEPYTKDGVQSMNIDKFKNLPVKEMMEHFGFKNVKTYYMGERGDGTYNDPADGADECMEYKDTHKGRVAIGYKNIEYNGLEKTVIGIVIRGTAEDDDWDSDFDMGDIRIKELPTPIRDKDLKELGYDVQYREELDHFIDGYDDWIWDYHHAGFDIIANRILEVIGNYINEYGSNFKGQRSFWVTGHSMGAGVANLVSASLVYGECGGNADNVYCYTFAAPNTFYRTDSHYERKSLAIPGQNVVGTYAEPKGVRYRCIFNIVNDDDFVPKLPMEECEWTKYGRVAIKSIEKDIKPKLKERDSNLEKNDYVTFIKKKYNSDIKKISTLIRELNGIYIDVVGMRRDTYDFNKNSDYETILSMYDSLIMGDYTKPYQKAYNDSYAIKQLQVPAYFMQSIAYAKHDGIFNSLIFKTKRFASKYNNSRTKLIDCAAPWAGKIMDYPHYLESYFSLTKELEVNDFR